MRTNVDKWTNRTSLIQFWTNSSKTESILENIGEKKAERAGAEMWRLRDGGEEQEVPHSQSSAQLWPLPKPFPCGIPGRAEQEIKAGNEHPLSCCCTNPTSPCSGHEGCRSCPGAGNWQRTGDQHSHSRVPAGMAFLHVPSSPAAPPCAGQGLGCPLCQGGIATLFPWEKGGDGEGRMFCTCKPWGLVPPPSVPPGSRSHGVSSRWQPQGDRDQPAAVLPHHPQVPGGGTLSSAHK